MKRNAWKRFGAVLLSGAMVLTTPAMGVLAEEVAVAAAEETAAVEVAAEEEAEELDVTEEADVEEVVTETALTEEAVEEVQENLVEEAASEEEQIIENEVIFDEVDLAEMEAVDSDAATLPDMEISDKTIVPDDEFWIEKMVYLYGEDEDGGWVSIPVVITDLKVSVIEGAEDVISITEDEEEWCVYGNSIGKAEITMTYEAEEEGYASKTKTFTVNVVNSVYELELTRSISGDTLLQGESMEICGQLQERTQDGYTPVSESEYDVVWNVTFEGETCLEYEENGHILSLTGKDVWGWGYIEAAAYVDGVLVDAASMSIEVADNYYKLVFSEYETQGDLEVELFQGESITLTPQLMQYTTENKDGAVVTDGIYMRWSGWDSSELEIKDSDGNILDPTGDAVGTAPFTLTKLTPYTAWANVHATNLIVEDMGDGTTYEYYEEITNGKGVMLAEKWVDIKFDGLTEDGYTFIFNDGSPTITVDTTEFSVADWTIEWFLGEWNNEVQEYIPYDNVPSGILSANGAALTIDGAKLYEWSQNAYKSSVTVVAVLKVGGNQVNMGSFIANIREACESYDGLFADQSEQLYRNYWYLYDGKMEGYIQNSVYPNGKWMYFDVLDVTSSDPSVWEVTKDSETGNIKVEAVGYGTASVTVKFNGLSGEPETITRTATVVDEVFWCYLSTSTLIAGQTTKLQNEVYRVSYSYNGETAEHMYINEELAESEYTVSYSNYPESRFTIDEDGTISVGTETGNFPLTVTYNFTDSTGNTRTIVVETELYVCTMWRDLIIEKSEVTANPGAMVTVEAFGPKVMEYTLEYPDGKEDSNTYYVFWDEDSDYFTVTADGKGLCIASDIPEEDLNQWYYVQIANVTNDTYQMFRYVGIHVVGTHEHVWSDYAVTKAATCIAAGSKTAKCTVSGCTETKTEVIPATGHNMVNGKVISEATVLKEKQQQLVCKNGCGHTETVSVKGTKLTPTITLTESSIVLQVKKSTTAFTISGLAKGDSIKSIELAKGGDVYVSLTNKNLSKGTMKLTGKKAGSTKLIITLASGTKEVPIKVQKGAVKTTKLTDTNTRVTLAKKGAKLKVTPSRVPFTSADKIKYTVKNKKVAKVASNGTITAVAPGTTTVTAKAGKGKITYNVVVKGITLSKTSVTVKKGKTATLKVTKCGISGTPTFKSSNTAVATVDANGKVTGIKKGSATITVKLNGYTAKCKIKVKK